MKMFKKVSAIFLCLAMLLSVLAFVSCDKETPDEGGNDAGKLTEDGKMIYSVSVKDALDNAYTSGVIVQFLKDGAQVAMQVCNENGVAEKALEPGEYDVELMFTGDAESYHYDKGNLKVTEEDASLEVILAYATTGEGKTLYANSKDNIAHNIGVGCTYVTLDTENRTYFLFTPEKAGMYQFAVVDNVGAIGYYGAPHFVQDNSALEVIDNKFDISISSSMIGSGDSGTTVLVIGVDSYDGAQECIISVERIGDAAFSVEDLPWTVYQTTAELSEYTVPAGATIKEFDIKASTDTYNLVYNEEDGFYHLDSANGPLVLVRLTQDPKYLACFKNILDRSGVTKYHYDEEGNIVKKETFADCLIEYFEYVDDEYGVYPLTEDLKHIITERGEYVGWWDVNSYSYLFKDDNGDKLLGINPDIAWLFMCCYVG